MIIRKIKDIRYFSLLPVPYLTYFRTLLIINSFEVLICIGRLQIRSRQSQCGESIYRPLDNFILCYAAVFIYFYTLLTRLGYFSTLIIFMFSSGPGGTVIPIESPCREFYNETSLPQHVIDTAHFQMHPFYPLVYTSCSVNLLPLICSVYLPVLDTVSRNILQPCWDLCDQVSMDCSYAIRKLKFPISSLLQQCSSKPAPGNTTITKCFCKYAIFFDHPYCIL